MPAKSRPARQEQGTALERARESFHQGVWTSALAEFCAADRDCSLEARDLEMCALAAHLSGKDMESGEMLNRAHQAYFSANDVRGAARTAFWLGFSLQSQGESTQAGGWFARARRILDESRLDCVEQGYLLLAAGRRSFYEGATVAAFATFREAIKIGDRFGDRDLVAMARQGQGRALIRQGDLAQGLALLDEAMVSVTAGEVSVATIGAIYCSVIEACSEILDLRRAHEWTLALEQWCKSQPEFLPYRSHCLVRRAEMLQLHGAWNEALEEACQARDMLLSPTPKRAVKAAYYRIAELHRLRGEYDDAEKAYRKAGEWGDGFAAPGLALLRSAQGDIDTARALVRRAAEEKLDSCSRARVLEAMVDIMLAADELEAAQAAAAELRQIAETLDAPLLHATSARANGALAVATGQFANAVLFLRQASVGFGELNAPYDVAKTRVLLAKALRAQGDDRLAELELQAACDSFQHLGAQPDLNRVNSLLKPAALKDRILTARELEVLKLVASGATNRKIASSLAISEKTVARHVSNIFTKLDLNSRAAATAYAYQHSLA